MFKRMSVGLAFLGATSFALAVEPVAPIVMVNIPAGTLTMGCMTGRDNKGVACDKDEFPAHNVSIPAFQLGKYEVTQGQWRAIMGRIPLALKNCDDNCPVGNVSWDEAQVFIQKLNAKTQNQFRLPTESEWEYACRGGEASLYCGGNQLDELAWHSKNTQGFARPVGNKKANAFGLFDMTGNVWEWVQDCRHASYTGAPVSGNAWETACEGDRRRIRGGGFDSDTKSARAAFRLSFAPSTRYFYTGFRLAKSSKP